MTQPAYDYIRDNDNLPRLYETEHIPAEDKIIPVKLFMPGTATTWYLAEYNPEEQLAFGYAVLNGDLQMAEWGYISIAEVAALRLPWADLPPERDLHWRPTRFGDIDLETARPKVKEAVPAPWTKLRPKYDGSDFKLRDLALGMSVNAPLLLLDEAEETIVAAQLLGVPQAVNANWAALMGGGKQHYILNTLVKLQGAKQHVKLEKVLPETGWKELWLLHKQASFNELDAGTPFFYLLHRDKEPFPANFIGLLDKAISIPLQADWAGHLFAAGWQQELIQPLPAKHCVGCTGYKVYSQGWETIIADGVIHGQLTF